MKQLLLLNPILFFFSCIASSSSSSTTDNSLQNPSFENVTSNVTTSRFSLLDPTNSTNIPGWSFGGTVYYVTSFPDNGGAHAIQLAENGTINQTLRVRESVDSIVDYVVSFNLAMPSDECVDYYNHTALNITVYQTRVLHGSKDFRYKRSEVFFYHGRNFSRRPWETNAFWLGQLGDGDYVNIEIKSVTTNNITRDHNVTGMSCWPLVDAFNVQKNQMRMWMNENLLSNGDFEAGKSLLKNSFEGVLLNPHQESFYSPLQDWSILGTIRYIDSTRYKVPRGKAAVELISEGDDTSGIEFGLILSPSFTSYTLNFTVGDANDSCVGDFVLHLQIGQQNVHDFTMMSNGGGSFSRRSITFKAQASSTSIIDPFTIAFYSVNETRTSDGVLCGPVLDNIVLVGSYVETRGIKVYDGVLIISLLLAYLVIILI